MKEEHLSTHKNEMTAKNIGEFKVVLTLMPLGKKEIRMTTPSQGFNGFLLKVPRRDVAGASKQ